MENKTTIVLLLLLFVTIGIILVATEPWVNEKEITVKVWDATGSLDQSSYEPISGAPTSVGLYRFVPNENIAYHGKYEKLENIDLRMENHTFNAVIKVSEDRLDNEYGLFEERLCVGYPSFGGKPKFQDKIIKTLNSEEDNYILYHAKYIGPLPE